MGRGRGRGGKRVLKRDFREPRDNQWREKRQRVGDGWAEPELKNELFEEYYKAQQICPEEEFEDFLEALRKPLPTTFRINGSGKFADDLRAKLEKDFFSKFNAGPIRIDGDLIEPPKPLPWYPNKLAWQFNFSRSQLRKLPVLEALHEFIKRENEVGAITRQEAVSMVPPLFLDVRPFHRVLDMCAAPGSKTFQLLEALHAGPEAPTGLVIANDADAQRCNLLTHQTKRMCSPALLVTNHEAQAFPLVHNFGPEAAQEKHVLFDRILCDVPCSGDGTMRKAPDIWRRWGVANGNGLHSLQLKITLRACELLRVGGRLVYSTCTFNPIEDEAVVAEVLRRTKGSFQLLDVSDQLPELRRLPGLQRWKVRDRNAWFESWEEGKTGHKLDPTMFPDEASDALPLSRCMRFLPHHQDTGGFFVAVLQKVSPLEGLQYPTLEHRQTRNKDKKAGISRRQQAKGGAEGEKGEASEAVAEAGVGAEGEQPEAKGEGAAPSKEGAEADGGREVPEEVVAEEAGDAPSAAETDAPEGPPPAAAAAEDSQQVAGVASAAPDEGPPPAAAAEGAAEGEQAAPPAAERPIPVWGGIRGGGGRNREGGKWRGVDPIVPFLDPTHIAALRSFYGLSEDCPVVQALIARSEEPKPKRLSYVSASVKELLTKDTRELLKITAAGIKVFERQEDKGGLLGCSYRIAQEGLPSLLPHITKQRFQPTVQELLEVLTDRIVRLPESSKVHITRPAQQAQQAAAPPAAADPAPAAPEDAPAAPAAPQQGDAAQQAQQGGEAEQDPLSASKGFMAQAKVELRDPHTLDQLDGVAYGCCVATLRDEDAAALGFAVGSEAEGALAAAAPLAISCWRGRGNLNVLVSKQECAQVAGQIREAQQAQQAGSADAAGAEAGAGAEQAQQGGVVQPAAAQAEEQGVEKREG